MLSRENQIKEEYEFLKEIGKGAYGKVYKARLRVFPHHLRAIKVIAKKHLRNPTQILNEIKVMGRLDHPHITKLYETFEDERNLFLVLEYAIHYIAIALEMSFMRDLQNVKCLHSSWHVVFSSRW